MEKERLFRFKKFSIRHSLSAMKVGTDGVLLGAWAPVEGSHIVWDVGSGSGLIALMLAQRSIADIYGIEIDIPAADEMAFNFDNSPWRDRLHAVYGDINHVLDQLPPPDLIVCNPPYFKDALKSPEQSRTVARHESTLDIAELIGIASRCLSGSGLLAIILPTDRASDVEWEASLCGLCINKRVDIATSMCKPASRTLWLIGRGECVFSCESVCLRDQNNSYSQWYRDLTIDYYLHLNG